MPQIGVSLLLEVVALKRLRADLDRCLISTDQYGDTVPSAFVEALIIAEDHRSKLHPGIDVIAMVRALWVKATSGQIQGASTIEQQYVRTISNRYERTVTRKLREQILALMLARRVNKQAIASAYLSVAFYGSGSIGINGLKARFGDDLSQVPFNQALLIVAQLKYPRPLHPTAKWHRKITSRQVLLQSRAESAVNKSLQRIFDPQAILLSKNGLRLKRRRVQVLADSMNRADHLSSRMASPLSEGTSRSRHNSLIMK